MNHINLPIWAINQQAFDAVMVQFDLAEMVDGELVYHKDLRGVDQPGAQVLPDQDSGIKLDEEGNPVGYNDNLPGFYYNLRAVYYEPRGSRVSLAEILTYAMDATTGTHILDEDDNYIVMDQYEDVDVNGEMVRQLKNIAYRCNIPQRVLYAGGEIIDAKGFPGDPKAPKHLDIKDNDGNVIFRVFDPDDINTPHNSFA